MSTAIEEMLNSPPPPPVAPSPSFGDSKRNRRYTKLVTERTALMQARFGKLGPHYDLLIDQAAACYAALRCVDEGLGVMTSTEYNQRSESLRKVIAQIQQYTEKNKSEVIQQARQDGAAVVLEIARQALPPEQVGVLGEAVRKALSA